MASLAIDAIDVVDENGVFRPVQPVSLPEGSRGSLVASSLDAPPITKTAGICGGRACIAGTRITVWGLVSYRNLGLDERAILATVPLLTSDQLSAAFRYADEKADEIAHDLAENEDGESARSGLAGEVFRIVRGSARQPR
jgi:uncharacterized protein (DUF433 family)